MNQNIERFNICFHLHAMSDFGFSDKGDGSYSRSHTNNAECYAEKCKYRGRCLIAVMRATKPKDDKVQEE